MSEPLYFAVPDPDDPGRMTYWRTVRRGQIKAWPAKARYGPTLWKTPGEGREHVVPDGLNPKDRREWVKQWTVSHRWPYIRRVLDAINADVAGCAARFAAFTTRCGWCGRKLTDEASKTYGIGPDCRSPLSDDVLAKASEAIGRAHAARRADG